MPKPKVKNGKVKTYYLEEDTIEEINRSAGLNELSASAYIDFLIKRDNIAQNPMEKVKEIQHRKEELQERIKEIEIEEKEAIEDASRLHEWQEAKRIKKPQALKIIKRKILEKDFEAAEEIAKTWQRMTGIPAMELLFEANQQIRRSGI